MHIIFLWRVLGIHNPIRGGGAEGPSIFVTERHGVGRILTKRKGSWFSHFWFVQGRIDTSVSLGELSYLTLVASSRLWRVKPLVCGPAHVVFFIFPLFWFFFSLLLFISLFTIIFCFLILTFYFISSSLKIIIILDS